MTHAQGSHNSYQFGEWLGVKFYLVAEKNATQLDIMLRGIYELYSNYVLKNPFYEIDQPIRCELFDEELKALIFPRERVRA